MYIDLDNEAATWLRDFFENKGVLAAFLKVSEKLRKEQRLQVKEDWRDEFGSENLGRFGLAVVRTGAADYQPIGETPGRDLDLEHIWDTTETRICAVMDNTPPIIIGLNVGLKRSTYSNYRKAKVS